MERQANREGVMPIRAVTFDVGGTLMAPWPSVGHVYAQVAARHGLEISADILSARFKAAWRTFSPFENSRDNWSKLVDETFKGLCAEKPSATFFPELYEAFAQASAWRIFPDAFPALEALASRGIRLGVISNWDERLRGLLRGLKLESRFETLTISCEVGVSKPSPIIFRRAAEQLGLPPASILHVGDSLEMDVHGAEAAGFQAVRISRGTARAAPSEVILLSDLPAKLEDLARGAN